MNQVSFTRPGIASLLTPKAGSAQACNTSLAVIKTFTTLLTGTITSLSKPRLVNVPIKTGTIISPPPIPNIPARRPARIPRALKINISSNITKLTTICIF